MQLSYIKKSYLSILIITLAISGCVDEIDLNLDPQEYERLIVNGLVTDVDSVQTIILSRTLPYDSNEPNPPATGAVVTVESSDGHSYPFKETEPGYYRNSELAGEVGKTYTLNILYEGEVYHASSTMYETVAIDSIGFKKFQHGWPADMPHYEVLIYGQDSPEPDQFYVFKQSVNGVWSDTLLYWGVYMDAFFNGEYIEGESVRIIESRADSLEIQVMSMSICEDYLWFIDDVIWNYMPNMFFSPPKANVKGNLSNGAFGFFLASSVHYSEKRVLYRADYFD